MLTVAGNMQMKVSANCVIIHCSCAVNKSFFL